MNKKEKSIGKIMNNIEGLTFYGKRAGLLYDAVDGKLKYLYEPIDDICQSASLSSTKTVVYLPQ